MSDLTDSEAIELRELPDDWHWADLGDISLARLGKTPRKKDYRDEGVHKIIKFRDVKDGGEIKWTSDDKGYVDPSDDVTRSLKDLAPGDVLVTASAHMSEHIGKKIGLVSRIPPEYEKAYVVGEILQIRVGQGLLPKWVMYFLQSVDGYKAIQRRVHGVHLTGGRAQNIEIPIAPPEHQARIVAEIDKQFSRLDEAVASLKRVKANLKRYKAAVLKAAVEGKLTEEWRKQNPDVEPASTLLERILAERRTKWEEAELAKMKAKGKEPKNDKWKKRFKNPSGPVLSGLPELPTTWVWATPEQLASTDAYSLAIGPFGSNLKVKDYQTNGVPLIFVRNIRNSDFSDNSAKYVGAGKATELAAHSVNGGDILITKMGDPPGDACLYPIGSSRAIITADCIKWRLSELLPYQGYFVDTINSHCLAEQIRKITKGVAQQKVSLARFRIVAIPVPPVAEQSVVEDVMAGIHSLVAAQAQQVEAAIKRAESLRQSILGTAFRGVS